MRRKSLRVLGFVATLMMGLSMAACGGPKVDTTTEVTTCANDGSGDDSTGSAAAAGDVDFKTDGDITIFSVKAISGKEVGETAWVGICPCYEYLDEEDADEADLYFVYNKAENQKEYEFEVDMSMVQPGSYTMVFCPELGSGVIQNTWLMTKDDNGNIKCDFGKTTAKKEIVNVNENITMEKYDDAYVIFMVNDDVEVDAYSWLGLCPKGNYFSEEEADENDVYYTYLDDLYRNKYGCDKYIMDLNCVEEGEYTMVITTTDDSGDVVIQVDVTIDANKNLKF